MQKDIHRKDAKDAKKKYGRYALKKGSSASKRKKIPLRSLRLCGENVSAFVVKNINLEISYLWFDFSKFIR
jgi:hypothetical protein